MSSTVRVMREEELDAIREGFAGDEENQEEQLSAQENGEGQYLISWSENTPLGHLFLRWAGSHEIRRIKNENVVAATKAWIYRSGHWAIPYIRHVYQCQWQRSRLGQRHAVISIEKAH